MRYFLMSKRLLLSVVAVQGCFVMLKVDCEDKKRDIPLEKDDANLALVAHGVRKKKIVMINFDIYTISAKFSPLILKAAKTSSGDVLTDYLMEMISLAKYDKAPGVSVQLKFLRAVSTTQMVEAFNESFAGCDPNGTTKFKDVIKSSIGPAGLAIGDTIDFDWLNGGGLLISVRGEIKASFFDAAVERRLMEVYIDPARAVSPEVVTDLFKNLNVAVR